MPQYRILCGDLVGGGSQIREELAVHDLKWSKVLNAPGAMSGWVSLDDPKATRLNLDPGATAIYIERGGQLVWGGPLWTAQVDNIDRKLNLGAEGFWSYFRRRIIKNRVAMNNVTAASKNSHVPTADVVKTGVNGTPDNTNLYTNVDANVNPTDGFISDPNVGTSMTYLANAGIVGGTYSGLKIVSVRVVLQGTQRGGRVIIPQIRVGGTDYAAKGVLGFGNTLGVTAQLWTVSYTWSLNPNTGVAWLPSEVEAFASSNSFGWSAPNTATPDDDRVYQMRLEVSWGTDGTAVFLNTDQLAIARDLMTNSLAQPGSLGGITVGSELTTDNGGTFVGRDRTYYSYERKNLGEAVQQLAAVLNGFDFSIEVAWDTTGTIPQQVFHLYYPRRGRRIDGLVFNHNVLGTAKIGNSVDASQLANEIDAIGQGDGDGMLIASQADTSLLTRYPLLEDTFAAKDVNDPATLAAQALAQVGRRKLPIETPTIEKQASSVPQLGAFQEGDEGLVVISDGWINFNGFMRIMSYEVAVDNEGQETLTPTFVSADASVN